MSEKINEVHIKTYDEWLKYYKNATKEQVIEDLTQDVQYFADAVKDIKDLQQKVEQLEKENKELKQPQVFIDCENMEERYGRDLYEDYLKEKIEQLENIRKEAIRLLKKCGIVDEKGNFNAYLDTIELKDLLNILNKGE